MKALWIALANLRRMFRVRTNIFFVFVFPMVLILVLGATLGVVSTGSGPLGAALLRQLEQTPHLRVVTVSDPAALLTQVERGNLAAGVIIPPGYDAAARAGHTRCCATWPGRTSPPRNSARRSAARWPGRRPFSALPGSPSPSTPPSASEPT
jgi:ABC-2 type transport system permease protein